MSNSVYPDESSRPQAALNVVSAGKSEADRALELKSKAQKVLVELCQVMDEGLREGLLIRWVNIGINAFGRHDVVDLHIEKRF